MDMRCSSCGIEIQSDAISCPSCGRALDVSEAPPYLEDSVSIPYIPYSFDPLEQLSTDFPIGTEGATKQLLATGTRSISDTNVQPERLERAQYRGISKITCILLTILVLLGIIGGSGVISYAAGFHPAELNAQATAITRSIITSQSLATVTAIANSPQSIYDRITNTKPTISDALNNENHSTWFINNDGVSSCSFTNGAYHIHVSPIDNYYACLSTREYRNFVFRVQMSIIAGGFAGIIFRSTQSFYMNYQFSVADDGFYGLAVALSPQGGRALAYGRSSALNMGPGRSNLLSVMALNNSISLFINNQLITNVNDNTYNSGVFGFDAENYHHINTDVTFSNAQIWEIS
jgi:hypothetical protein